MIERLILVRPHLGRDGLIPLVGIVEYRIDVEHDAAERIKAVLDHLSDLELCTTNLAHDGSRRFSNYSPDKTVVKSAIVASGSALSDLIIHIGMPYRGLSRQPAGRDRPAPWPVSRLR